jgi:hypothetical protein
VAAGGRVLIRGGFRGPGGWLRRGVGFAVGPTVCGPQLRVPARRGDRYSFTGFFRPGRRRSGRIFRTIGDQTVAFSEPLATVRVGNSRPSPFDAHLVRARFSVRASKRGPLSLVAC